MTRLDAQSPIPEPGWAFRIRALHTSDTARPNLTGTWHRRCEQSADPACALWLLLAQHTDGAVSVAVLADHQHTPGAVTPLARHTALAPGTWTSAIAPLVAAHPWATHVHHPKPRTGRERAARAILAYLITRP